MTTAPADLIINDDSPVPCGPDCAYLDGACRCYHGEPSGPDPEWWIDLEPPF